MAKRRKSELQKQPTPPTLERIVERIEKRRARGRSPEDIAEYLRAVTTQFQLDVHRLPLTLVERAAWEGIERDIAEQEEKRRAAAAEAAKRQAEWQASLPPNLKREGVSPSAALHLLGCSRTELNRWAEDGRLPPDGQRYYHLGTGIRGRWARAWRPETIEVAKLHIEEWRAQDAKIGRPPGWKSARDICDTDFIKTIRLGDMREGTLIRERLAELQVGMTVADALRIQAQRPLTKWGLRCAIDKGRIVLEAEQSRREEEDVDLLVEHPQVEQEPRDPTEHTLGDEMLEGFEGEERWRYIRHRQREQRLRLKKIEEVRRRNGGRIICEVPNCGFNFAERYGLVYAQVHHIEQLSEAPKQGKKVTLNDLAVVCANCHVMIHIGGQCRSLETLILPKRTSAKPA